MKTCHVCQMLCDDSAELCPLCGADISGFEETEETLAEPEEKAVLNPVLLASLEDVVSAEIFKDILADNGIPYSTGEADGEGTIRVLFGGGFVSEDIYVDSSDYEAADKLYTEFLESESNFDGEFFDDEFAEEDIEELGE